MPENERAGGCVVVLYGCYAVQLLHCPRAPLRVLRCTRALLYGCCTVLYAPTLPNCRCSLVSRAEVQSQSRAVSSPANRKVRPTQEQRLCLMTSSSLVTRTSATRGGIVVTAVLSRCTGETLRAHLEQHRRNTQSGCSLDGTRLGIPVVIWWSAAVAKAVCARTYHTLQLLPRAKVPTYHHCCCCQTQTILGTCCLAPREREDLAFRVSACVRVCARACVRRIR